MQIIKTIPDMISFLEQIRSKPKQKNDLASIGFVPTMGYLHNGHLSLVEKARKENNTIVVSIFVNPLQFGKSEDLDRYPRDLERDIAMLSEYKVDAVFCPDHKSMYPEGYKTYVEVSYFSKMYCGKTRLGHFKGVTTAVIKLINIISPTNIYVGEKDFQQAFILKKMVADLNIQTEVVMCPIVRESDGLAMSSRNTYLSEEERKNALCLYKAVKLAKLSFKTGLTGVVTIRNKMVKLIEENNGVVEYIAFINEKTFKCVNAVKKDTRVIIAVKIGKTRLIDNISMR